MKELYIVNLFQDKLFPTSNIPPVLVRSLPAASKEAASVIVSNHVEISITVNDSRKEYGAGEFFATVEKFEVVEEGEEIKFKKVPKKR